MADGLERPTRDQLGELWVPKAARHCHLLNFVSFRLDEEQSKTRPLVLVGGFIHDLSSFMNQHPGGRGVLLSNIGKDATTAFLGGVYEHSHAAHNVRPLLPI